jgi:hypothetical protein
MASQQRFIYICWICGNPVQLEKCKTDEDGRAVHEECYSMKIALQNGNSPQNPNPA